MNDTNREAEIRERSDSLDLGKAVAFLGGVASQPRTSASYREHAEAAMGAIDLAYKDRRYLLSALDSEREARRELEKVGLELLREYDNEMEEDGFPFNFALRTAHAKLRALLTTEDSNKTPAVHTERNE